MIGNTLTSFFDNLATRSKNPFLGTFAIVWFCRNWELVFALFNFDESFTLQKKINFLSEKVQYDAFWPELGANIGWTFTVLIITYVLINIARGITNLFEKRLTPLIYKWTDYGSLVPREKYQDIIYRMEDLQGRLDKEVQEKIKIQVERDSLDKELEELKTNLAPEIVYNEMGSSDHEESDDNLFNQVSDSVIEGMTKKTGQIKHAILGLKKVRSKYKSKDYEFVKSAISTELRFYAEDYLNIIGDLMRLELIEIVEMENDSMAKYRLSELGKLVFNQLEKEDQ